MLDAMLEERRRRLTEEQLPIARLCAMFASANSREGSQAPDAQSFLTYPPQQAQPQGGLAIDKGAFQAWVKAHNGKRSHQDRR